jgi:ribosomal protein S17E
MRREENKQLLSRLAQVTNKQLLSRLAQVPVTNKQLLSGLAQVTNKQLLSGLAQVTNKQLLSGLAQVTNKQLLSGLAQVTNKQLLSRLAQVTLITVNMYTKSFCTSFPKNHSIKETKTQIGSISSGWVIIALGLPVTTKRGVLFLLKCHKKL